MNFRKLEDLKVPDELMEKLLAIPETEEQKAPAVIPWWRNRAVIAAASLVLVSVLSLIVYFLIGNKIDVPVAMKPSKSATEIVWSTDENGETVATEVIIVPDGHNDPNGTTPTEPKSGLERFIESIFGPRDNTAPTTAASDRGRTTPTTKTSPTEGGRRNPISPSQGAVTPTQGDQPIVSPTEAPVEPTESYDVPVEPWDDPPDPTEPPDEPTEAPKPPDDPPAPTVSPYTDTISDLVYIGDIPDGSVIYCWLYDDISHCRMYEDDAYTEMFYAEVTPLGDGYALLTYTPKAHGVVLPESGSYRYLWYLSEDGSHTGRRLKDGHAYLNN